MAKYQYKWLCLLLTAAFAVTSCIKEDNGGAHIPADGTEVTFSIKLPGVKNPGTRALDADDEERVETADVYVFDDTGKLVDIGYGRSITEDDTDPTVIVRNFSVTLVKANNRDVMVVSNARDIINAAFPGGVPLNGTVTKEIFRKAITMTLPDDGWNAAPGSAGYVSIPMWGERKEVNIDGGTVLTGANSIKISRMTARINVIINQGLVDAGKFEMTSVRLYNYNKKGLLIPDDDAVDGTWQDATPYADTPSLPLSPGFVDKPAILYDNIQNNGQSLKGEIYLFEAEKGIAPADGNWLTNPCIVIGGKYDGGSETFYRIDIVQKENNTAKYLHILRNNSYNITITDVKGPGKPDMDEAYNTLPVNIDTEVVAWNDHDMNEHLSDGQYQLTVDKNSFVFYDEGRPQTMKIYTDYPYGWKIEQSTLPSYLSGKITPDNDNSGTTVEVTIEPGDISLIDSSVPATESIFYSFWITAGSMRKQIFIEQINEPELTLNIEPEYLYFNRSSVKGKSVNITTYPDNIPIYFSEVAGDISWRPSGYPDPTEYGGSGLYTFHPDAINTNPAVQRTSSFSVMVTAGTKRLTKIIEIIQRATDLLFSWYPGTFSANPANDGEVNIFVSSESDWRVYDTENSSGLILSWTDNNRHQAGDDIPYYFKISPNNSWTERTAKFLVESTDEDFPAEYIEIKQDPQLPLLSLDKTGTLAFGAMAGEQTLNLGITSNAQWKYTVAGGDYNSVIASPASGTTGGTDSPGTPASTHTISFKSNPYTVAVGIPAATAATTSKAPNTVTLKFETTNPGGQTASQNITLTRAVPAYFNSATTAQTIARNATSVTLYAHTNTTWGYYANGAGSGTNLTAGTAGTYALNKSISMPVNATVWTTAAASENRTIPLYLRYVDSNGITQEVNNPVTILQPKYFISGGTSNVGANIPKTGKQVNVSVTGAFPANVVYARSALQSGSNWLGMGNATAVPATAVNGSTSTQTIMIPENTTWANRNVRIEYKHPGYTGDTYHVATAAVPQYGNVIGNPVLSHSSVSPDGDNVTVTFNNADYTNGWVQVRAVNASANDAILANAVTTNANKQATLYIPANTTGRREVKFQYIKYQAANGAWEGWGTPINTITQDIKPYIKVTNHLNQYGVGVLYFDGYWTKSFTIVVKGRHNNGEFTATVPARSTAGRTIVNIHGQGGVYNDQFGYWKVFTRPHPIDGVEMLIFSKDISTNGSHESYVINVTVQ